MASNVDVTIPADNVKANKSEFRAQNQTIKTEIEALQRKSNIPGLLAYGVLSFAVGNN